MADEKLNTGQEENPQPSLFDNGPEGAPAQDAPTPEPPAPENVPEQAAGDAPAQDAPAGAPGEVNVSADQIEKLMAERRAAERAEVEKNEPPEPGQPPPSPGGKYRHGRRTAKSVLSPVSVPCGGGYKRNHAGNSIGPLERKPYLPRRTAGNHLELPGRIQNMMLGLEGEHQNGT